MYSMVCWSVCHDREPCKKAEPNDMAFVLWARVDSRNRVFDGVEILHMNGAILRGGEGTAHCKLQGRSAVSCAKTAEPIEMPFGVGAGLAYGSMFLI